MARETPALRRQDGPFFATSACYDASPDMYALSLHAAGRKACAHQTTFDSCVSTFAAAPRPMGIIWRKPLLAIVLLTQGAHGPPRLQKTSSCYQSPNPKTQAPSPKPCVLVLPSRTRSRSHRQRSPPFLQGSCFVCTPDQRFDARRVRRKGRGVNCSRPRRPSSRRIRRDRATGKRSLSNPPTCCTATTWGLWSRRSPLTATHAHVATARFPSAPLHAVAVFRLA